MDFAPINGRRRAQKRKYGLKYVGKLSCTVRALRQEKRT